jgi:DNA polymerase III subunit delta'
VTRWRGHAAARAAFRAAMSGGALHHAWLFAGPEGVGKAAFAREASARLLAEAAGERGSGNFGLAAESRTAAMMAAGAHPDYRELCRLPKDPDKPAELARSIPIAQIRALLPMFATAPAIAARRVVMIDSIDDVERPGASNALLKSLEEPPAGTIFLLISHAPGRLLPTIRSRCRLLRFEPLAPDEMRAALGDALPEASPGEIDALVRIGGGSPGRALRYAGLDIGGIDDALAAIARDGDPGNAQRLKLSRGLSGKASQPRYEAFLERAPSFIAEAAPLRHGPDLATALDTYAEARDLAAAARALSLDPAGTVLEMAGLVARLHARGAMH